MWRSLVLGSLLISTSCGRPERKPYGSGPSSREAASAGFDAEIARNAGSLLAEGREIFRHDTFGSEAFWGDTLGLHEAIAGGGSAGDGVSPAAALAMGLKVDAEALPTDLVEKMKKKQVDLDDPAVTVALLKLNAVVGVRGVFKNDRLASVGITCALCHATVDDSFSAGIGRRRDGWPNRDLDVGKLVSLAPTLEPMAKALQTDVAGLKKVLLSWGPGKYDPQLDQDGKAWRPDGRTGALLLPPAYGLAGVNLHTYTGIGSVTYWNAYVANTQMHGQGVFYDPRFNDAERFPGAVRNKTWNLRAEQDRVTAKLAALHVYQLAIPAPRPPEGSFDKASAGRGMLLFSGKAGCARCHVPPLYTEPGHNLHAPGEIGIDDFQAQRSPTRAYRTTPLRGLWSRQKGGFYHDGRFATPADVVEHYDRHFKLGLSDDEKRDLVQFLLSL
jgi:hypothetical protein